MYKLSRHTFSINSYFVFCFQFLGNEILHFIADNGVTIGSDTFYKDLIRGCFSTEKIINGVVGLVDFIPDDDSDEDFESSGKEASVSLGKENIGQFN